MELFAAAFAAWTGVPTRSRKFSYDDDGITGKFDSYFTAAFERGHR
ncbi:hypothetical protein [Nocardia brevicatena]|nr:hypothetical protein [Nocardia brevicatena]